MIPEMASFSFVPVDGSQKLRLLVRGEPGKVDEERASEILEHEHLKILVGLRDDGREKGDDSEDEGLVYWTCEFSHEYITTNGEYRTSSEQPQGRWTIFHEVVEANMYPLSRISCLR